MGKEKIVKKLWNALGRIIDRNKDTRQVDDLCRMCFLLHDLDQKIKEY